MSDRWVETFRLCYCGCEEKHHHEITGRCFYCFADDCAGFEYDEESTIMALAEAETGEVPEAEMSVLTNEQSDREIQNTLSDLKSAYETVSPAMSERTREMIRGAYFIIVALVASRNHLRQERVDAVQALLVARDIITGWTEDVEGRVTIHKDAIFKAVNAAIENLQGGE